MSKEDLTESFQAFKVPNGTGTYDIRIIVPKSQYLLAAEDSGCYYIMPLEALTSHDDQRQRLYEGVEE